MNHDNPEVRARRKKKTRAGEPGRSFALFVAGGIGLDGDAARRLFENAVRRRCPVTARRLSGLLPAGVETAQD